MTKVRILESEVAAAQRAEKTAKSKEISATESASRAFASVAELRSQLTVAQNSIQEVSLHGVISTPFTSFFSLMCMMSLFSICAA
jgi:hypothetical protein